MLGVQTWTLNEVSETMEIPDPLALLPGGAWVRAQENAGVNTEREKGETFCLKATVLCHG